MIIREAKFVTSAADRRGFLRPDKPLVAVSGRSNVGKSSFINMLAGRNGLARTSAEPGRTRLVNYFDFGEFLLADLPGYGFAKVSKAEKARWARLMEEFFADRANCAHAFSLVDVRHMPTADDVNMVNFLYAGLIPFTIIATKADKVSRMAAKNNVSGIAATLKCGTADIILTSSQTRLGLDEVLARLQRVVCPDTPAEENTEEDMKKVEGTED